jgi:HD-GYP domain-containing protein (c-di-GMP phosphodiesterase class II)
MSSEASLSERYEICATRLAIARAKVSANRHAEDDETYLDELIAAEKSARPDVRMHADRVGFFAWKLARKLGLGEEKSSMIREAARRHDIGKLDTPDDILYAPRALTAEEREVIKAHTLDGAERLLQKPGPLANLSAMVALYHHESYDGKGYFGLKGDEIPMEARIVQIADVFEAMTAERAYKKTLEPAEVLGMMTRAEDPQGRGLSRQAFDPAMLAAFAEIAVEAHAEAKKGVEPKPGIPRLKPARAEAAPRRVPGPVGN